MNSSENHHTNAGSSIGGILVLIIVIVLGVHVWHYFQNRSRDKLFFKDTATVLACKRPYIYDVESNCAYVTAKALGDNITSLSAANGSSAIGFETHCDVMAKDTSVPICSWITNTGATWDVFPGTTAKASIN